MQRHQSRVLLDDNYIDQRVRAALLSYPSAMNSPLDAALDYHNPNVVEKIQRDFPVDDAEAMDIFTETKKWLWFIATTDMPRPGLTSARAWLRTH